MTLQRAFRKDERIVPCALTSDRLCQLIAQLTLVSLLLSAYFVQLISVSLFCQLELPTFACTPSIRLQKRRWLASTGFSSLERTTSNPQRSASHARPPARKAEYRDQLGGTGNAVNNRPSHTMGVIGAALGRHLLNYIWDRVGGMRKRIRRLILY